MKLHPHQKKHSQIPCKHSQLLPRVTRLRGIAELREYARETRHGGISLELWLRRPENDWHTLPTEILERFPQDVWEPAALEISYAGHIDRMRIAAERMQRQEDKKIPPTIDYNAIPAMKTEARQRLNRVRPATIGQAARIPGITPADIALLLVHVKKGE